MVSFVWLVSNAVSRRSKVTYFRLLILYVYNRYGPILTTVPIQKYICKYLHFQLFPILTNTKLKSNDIYILQKYNSTYLGLRWTRIDHNCTPSQVH